MKLRKNVCTKCNDVTDGAESVCKSCGVEFYTPKDRDQFVLIHLAKNEVLETDRCTNPKIVAQLETGNWIIGPIKKEGA